MPSQLDVDKIRNTSAVDTLTIDASGNTTLGGNLVLPSTRTIKNENNNNVVSVTSAGNVTVGGAGTVTVGGSGNVSLGTGNVTLGGGSGAVTLGGSGNLVLSGSGIDFGTGTDGTGTVTGGVLDDYEEGTFGGSITNGSYTGYYIKVGDLVALNGRVDTTSTHSGIVGNITAPFANKSNNYVAGSVWGVINPYNHQLLAAFINSGSSTIEWYSNSGGSGISATGTNGFQFSISYMVG
jgi:hypothetical protein